MNPQAQPAPDATLPEPIDRGEVDWRRAVSVSYLVRQRFRYDYPQPIRQLRHRLMVVPPDRHGDQRTVMSQVSASVPTRTRRWRDPQGNVCLEFAAPEVEASIEFETRIVVSRSPGGAPPQRFTGIGPLATTPLTAPTRALVQAAHRLRGHGRRGLDLAEAANDWVHGALAYEHDATGVHTTAATALALGKGVCQDYAHVMLALCRLLRLRARYVSGHVLGEGGTHAWVEVLVPSGSSRGEVVALDPTYGGRADLAHVTVATGRDYRDVAPTSGVYVGSVPGVLTASKRVDVIGVEYGSGGRPPASA